MLKKSRKLLGVILAVVMMIGILPAFAASANEDQCEIIVEFDMPEQPELSVLSSVGVKSVSRGDFITQAIRTDGSLWGWGLGILGDGASTTTQRTPKHIQPGTTWSIIELGSATTFAIRTDGSLWTWGIDLSNRTESGAFPGNRTPRQVQPGTTWIDVATDMSRAYAIRNDGSLWAWGSNDRGLLGDGTMIYRPEPVQIQPGTTWRSVSAGNMHTSAIRADGSLWSWGENAHGRVGDGTRIDRLSPVHIEPGTTWKNVSVGVSHSLAIRSDDTLWGWGSDNIAIAQEPVFGLPPALSPIQIQPGTTWASAIAGSNVSYGIRTDGSLWAWGSNFRGRLGIGIYSEDSETRSTPIHIQPGTTWSTVDSYSFSTFGIRTDGSLWAWGRNLGNRLGINSEEEWILSPTEVTNWGDTGSGTTTPPGGTTSPPPANQQWQTPESTNRFNDVPNDNWQNAAVSWADQNGITTGSPAGSPTFKPNDTITRAEFVTFFHRIYGSPVATRATFSDMPTNDAFQNAISWAFAEGITTGSPAGSDTFMPNNNITREQIAAMLHRYIGGGTPAPEDRLDDYADNGAISTWTGARAAVNWAAYNEIMGVGTSTLNPRGNATRAEAVTMLYRVVEIFDIPAP